MIHFFRFVDFIALDNDIAGIEYSNAASDNSPWGGAMIKDSLMVGHSELREINSYVLRIGSQSNCTRNGLKLPFSSRLTVSNVTLVNFNEKNCVSLATCSHCKPQDGGAIVRLNNLTFTNSPNVAAFPFNHATVLYDEDGSITGYSGGRILPYMGILNPTICKKASNMSHGVPGAICEYGDFARVSWNKLKPGSIDEKDAYLDNQYGRDVVKWRKKSKTHPKGYTAFLPIGDTLLLSFQNLSHLTNISYNMGVYELQPEGYSYIKHSFKQTPDYFRTTGKFVNSTSELPDPAQSRHGDWFYEKAKRNITYIVSGKSNSRLQPDVKKIQFNVYRCFFEKCIVPTPPPPPKGRPSDARMWSNIKSWEGTEKGYGGYNNKLPANGDNVMINSGWFMVADTTLPVMKVLYIYGTLELENGRNHKLQANIIIITGLSGMLIAGWADKPMPNNVLISLIGNHDTKDLPLPNGPNLGAKALGVFGRLQLFGKKHKIHWTRLAQSIDVNATKIYLIDQVDWNIGDEIIITTSTFESRQAEKFIITDVKENGTVLELKTPATYSHTASQYSVKGFNFSMSAKVALLTRTIIIEGANEPARSLEDQSFGCRVLVGKYTQSGLTYVGKAQISEVQFKHCGQYGYTEPYDPR